MSGYCLTRSWAIWGPYFPIAIAGKEELEELGVLDRLEERGRAIGQKPRGDTRSVSIGLAGAGGTSSAFIGPAAARRVKTEPPE